MYEIYYDIKGVSLLKKKNISILAAVAAAMIITVIMIANVQTDMEQTNVDVPMTSESVTLAPTNTAENGPAVTSDESETPVDGKDGMAETNEEPDKSSGNSNSGDESVTPTPTPTPTQDPSPTTTPEPAQSPGIEDGGLTPDERQQIDDTNDMITGNQPPMPTPDPSNSLDNW
jgi:hypothetical protein